MRLLFPVFSSLLAAAALSASGASDGLYHFVAEIPIGGEGGWDILTVDSPAHRLYLSHATKVVVVDLEKNAVAGEITDTPGVHAFAVAPELQRGFSSNGKENKVSVVDLTTLKTTAKLETGESPDAMAYDDKRS
jgi:YVTN family beta-propeller protein